MRISRQCPPSVRLTTETGVLEALLAQWPPAAGVEPCGVIFGRREEEAAWLVAVQVLKNVHPQPATAFLLDPGEQLQARAKAREQGMEVVALWHGHLRGPAIPSDEDAWGLAHAVEIGAAPDLMVLLGRAHGTAPVVRAWRVRAQYARELVLRV